MQSSEKPAKLKKANWTQLNQFLGDIASYRREKAALAAERSHCAEMSQARNSQESDQHLEEGSEDDDDEYITINEVDVDDEDNLEEYAEMLLEYKESMKEEEEWIQEMELLLISEVTESLNNLRACQQLAAEAHKVRAKRSEGDSQQQRKSSAEIVLSQRRSSAAEIRTQSAKAAKKVRRAKARELKARKALVQALKKRHERILNKSGGQKGVASKRKKSQWDDARKNVKQEFEKDLERIKQNILSG